MAYSAHPSYSGLFLTVEGVDGAGKSSHLDWLADALRAQGKTVVLTREPGGTSVGERLREMLLHEAMDLETETLLMFAARREHLAQVILPALMRGDVVISDRFTDATYAYQGGGRGVSRNKILQLEQWVQGGLQPNLTLLFDLPLTIAAQRLAQGRAQLDKFEQESQVFFENTRAAYLERAADAPNRICIIDSAQSLEATRAQVAHAVLSQLNLNLTAYL
jgi:dTMP kinase